MNIRQLPPQQATVLQLICKELSPPQISKKMGISEKTFFNHRATLCKKTKAKTNIGLYKFALKHGYV